jgi:RNA polymerase sigma factor (sigma-70 family)
VSAGDGTPDTGGSQAAIEPPRPDVAALYVRHHARLRRHALSRLPEHLRDDADVALMNVFTNLIAKAEAGTLRQPDNWEAYLIKAVSNACISLVRAQRPEIALDQETPEIAELDRRVGGDPTAEDAVEHVDDTATIARARVALDNLEPRSRSIVIGKIWHEQSDRALGLELGITGQRVGQLYREALQQLREEVTHHDD